MKEEWKFDELFLVSLVLFLAGEYFYWHAIYVFGEKDEGMLDSIVRVFPFFFGFVNFAFYNFGKFYRRKIFIKALFCFVIAGFLYFISPFVEVLHPVRLIVMIICTLFYSLSATLAVMRYNAPSLLGPYQVIGKLID
jgi:hypothetical protein